MTRKGIHVNLNMLPVLLIGLCGLGLSVFAYHNVLTFETEEAQETFDIVARQHLSAVHDSITDVMNVFVSIGHFIESSPSMNRASFQRFAEKMIQLNPSLHVIGWMPYLTQDQMQGYEESARQEGLTSFAFWETDLASQHIPAAQRNEHFPIYYYASSDSTPSMLGFDTASDPMFYDAIAAARNSGQLEIKTLHLESEAPTCERSILLFYPVYESPPYKEVLKGIAFGIVQPCDLFNKINLANEETTALSVALYDEDVPAGAGLIYPRGFPYKKPELIPPPLKQQRTITAANSHWNISVFPSETDSYQTVEWIGGMVGGGVLLITVLMCAYARQRILRSLYIKKILDEKTQQIDESLALITKAKEEAESGNKAKSAFLANMSHEIRTPLNGVLATAELLFNTELTAKQKQYVEIMRSSGELLLMVINDILDLSKIEAGKIELHAKPFNVRQETEMVASLYHAQAQAKNLKLEFT